MSDPVNPAPHPAVVEIAGASTGDPDINAQFHELAAHVAATASPEHIESLLAKVVEVWKSVTAVFEDKTA